MDTKAFKNEIRAYYRDAADEKAEAFRKTLFAELDSLVTPSMTGYQRKALQYKTITAHVDPVLFPHSPFYHETGTLCALTDGYGCFQGHFHAGAWNQVRTGGEYEKRLPELMKQKNKQAGELLYLICGPFSDTCQHFIFNCKPLFKSGLKGLYDRACEALTDAQGEEKDFLEAAKAGLWCMKEIADKFSAKAKKMAEDAQGEEKANLLRIADSAARTPWEAPRSFYEALNLLAFTRKVPGALEGVGFNTFGRPDVELLPFYENDLKEGRLTKEEAYELIRAFLLTWDLHYDHDMKMVAYADHELENTYTLGGCDENGEPVWNDLTEMFLRATREEKIIFPKIKVRYSVSSPKEYLTAAASDVIRGTTAVLFQNDDTSIPALLRAGFEEKDARDYIVTGCWGLTGNGNLMDDHGNYVNLLKAFEFSVHNEQDKMAACGLWFEPLDDAADFDEVYARTLENFRRLLHERNRMTLEGKPLWHELDPVPLTSVTMEGCLESRKDLTNGGCKYHNENYMCVGFPNIVDSLLAVKRLCFEEKICTLKVLLTAVRQNWEGYDDLRQEALLSPCWGDESTESCALAKKLNEDLYGLFGELKTLWPGGKVDMGHLTYTEIRFWGEKTLATPDGRKSGDYFSQGLTPSRLHKIPSVTSVINSLKVLDGSMMRGNTVINLILPPEKMTAETCDAFLRASASSSMMCLQLNCVSKEELLDAQKHPENHRDLIVRVCGFSARFTSLSPQWQAEVLSRNFYE